MKLEEMSSYQDIKNYEHIFLKTVEPYKKGSYEKSVRTKWARLRAFAKLRASFKFKLKRFELN